jgi:tight adherence protein B
MTTGCLLVALAAWVALTPLRAWVGASRRFDDRMTRWAQSGAEWLVAKLQPASRRDEALLLCASIGAELRAGASPPSALVLAAQEVSIVPRAATAAQVGEPLAPALAEDARAAGSVPLAGVAACFAAAADSGAGLAAGLARSAALARAQQAVADDLASETAAPRATARILGLLPIIGLGLGQLLGADPLRWLVGAPAGWLCLGLGTMLLFAGRCWVQAILRRGLPSTGDALC